MAPHRTRFGSLAHYDKGGVEVIKDDPRNYVFSNVFEVASKAKPYEKVAVGKNIEYVIEAIRAEGTSGWRVAAQDEFALVMDGEVEVRLVKPDDPATGSGGQPRLDSARDRPHGSEDGPRSRAARSHDALARRSGLPVPRRAARGDPAADPGRTRHGGALGRDLSDDAAAPGLSEEDDAMTTDTVPELGSIEPNQHGYRTFTLGKFTFSRDQYFVHVRWPNGTHMLAADAFLRAIQRDVAWGFFYGIVNFDTVIGTVNHYGTVDLFAGRFNAQYRQAGLDYSENFKSDAISRLFEAILADWTNATFDPFASPEETGSAFGPKNGSNKRAITRHRVTAKRMIGAPGDEPIRTDDNGFPINRHFTDVSQEMPDVHAEPGFEDQVVSVNLFAYLSRSDVTWNPSVVSVCKNSLYCPTTEEYILPIIHGNDRVEWFVQLCDEIEWEVEDRDTGAVRARVTMKAGDVAAMPADIRHRGFSPKRSMLLVWENASPELPELYASGKMPPAPVQF